MTSPLAIRRDGPLVILTIDDPDNRNALSPALHQAIAAQCAAINADIAVKCVILTAAGDIFCAGGNIKDMYNRTNHFAGNAAEIRNTYVNGVQTIAKALYSLDVPVIAAINGPAIGAGMDIAAMCTIRMASEKAKFAESFIKLGLTSAAGGAWFLNRALGASMAAELTLTGETIDAQEALRIGFVSRVVAHDALMENAVALAGKITPHPAHSIRLNTRLLREAARLDLYAALEIGAGMQAVVQQTADHREAVAAVMERRPPVFIDR